ncbi:RidA family protein [Pseudomonas petrae]|uniref:RidA family protein n=1 Tax=Pseudomonas petrae TaxID=2912190 RepID=A0ABS9I817_9PSED|nr:RidA family protein [Pseudomonas petrae]MCF7543596.1 RidA family protein [Pseudomonas petrae]
MNHAIKHYPASLPFPFSKAVEVGGFLFLSGQVSMAADATPVYGDVKAQTQVIMESISRTLESVGAKLEDIFRVTVWLSDMKYFSEFNQTYTAYFSDGFPVRSVVSAKLVFDLDVEIEVQAVAPKAS